MATKASLPQDSIHSSAGQRKPRPAGSAHESEGSGKNTASTSLAAYYAGEIKPAAFVRAVRAEKIRSFGSEDICKAEDVLTETDPDLTRTIALLGKGPDAVARWVVEATKASLKSRFPDVNLGSHESAKRLFEGVLRMSFDDLAARSRQRRTRAQNLLRLLLAWLISKGDIAPADGLVSIKGCVKKKDVGRLMRSASFAKLQDLSLIAELFEVERKSISSDRDRWRELATGREAKLETQSAKLRETIEERDRLSSQLLSVQEELRQEKELRSLDATQQRGKMRAFLSDKLSPSLSDARDALDFDPPLIEAAQQRLDLATKAIEDETGKRHE